MRILGGTVPFLFASAFALSLSMPAQAATAVAPVTNTVAISGMAVQKFEVIETVGKEVRMRAICGIPSLSPCELVMPTLKKSVFEQVKTHIDAAYLGKLLDLSASNAKKGGKGFLVDQYLRTPICNLKDKVYAGEGGNSEKNHLDKSCGTACKATCSATAGTVSCRTNSASCEKERAITRGALVQMIWKQYDAVVQEFSKAETGHKLKLKESCQGVINDPKTRKVFTDANNEIQRFQTVNQGRKVSCPEPGAATSADSALSPQAEQAGCYLKSSRSTLEMLIATVATCEVFARAWEEFIPEMDAFKLIPEYTLKEAQLTTECKGKGANAQAYEECINTYYKANIANAFVRQMATFGDAPLEIPSTTSK